MDASPAKKRTPAQSHVIGFLLDYGIYLAYIFVFAVFSILTPDFLKTTNLITLLLQIVTTGILAVGMQFVILVGEIDLSVGEIEAFAGMIAAGALAVHWPLALVIGAGIAAGLAIGLINGVATAYLNIPSFIATLATMSIAQGAAYTYSNGYVLSKGFTNAFDNLGQGFVSFLPVPVLIMLGLFVVGYFVLRHTVYGKHVYATGGSKRVARLMGINTRLVVLVTFLIAGSVAAVSGMITAARLSSALPTIGVNDNLSAIAAVIIGGTQFTGGEGNIWGALIGALLVGTIINGLTLVNVNYYVQLMVQGGIILFAVLLNKSRQSYLAGVG